MVYISLGKPGHSRKMKTTVSKNQKIHISAESWYLFTVVAAQPCRSVKASMSPVYWFCREKGNKKCAYVLMPKQEKEGRNLILWPNARAAMLMQERPSGDGEGAQPDGADGSAPPGGGDDALLLNLRNPQQTPASSLQSVSWEPPS
jgi:hypothetical protein